MDTLLTIATPTYNRAYTLTACYESLCAQTDQRFVWMVIDDGSTDNTEKMIDKWIEDNRIRILYLKKSNGGKASALNVGIGKMNTKYATCLDSDDTFFPDAVGLALEELERYCSEPDCCGVLALRNNPDGSVMGEKTIPNEMIRVTAADIFLKLKLETELICFYKTEILKKYRFPEFEGEKFVSPAWMQYTVTQKYYFRTSWNKICSCQYIEDGLTKNKKKVIKKNPKGYLCVKKYSFNLAPSLGLRIKHGIMYDYGCILSKNDNWLEGVDHKILAIVLRPLARVIYFSRK